MPEPLLYLQSLGAAAVFGAAGVLVLAGRRAAGPARLNAACVLAGCLGIIAGCWLLRWHLVWPPASALISTRTRDAGVVSPSIKTEPLT